MGQHNCLRLENSHKGLLVIRGIDPYIDLPENSIWQRAVGSCIRCVGEYYTTTDGKFKYPRNKNPYLACDITKRGLNIPTYIGAMSCKDCHYNCLLRSKESTEIKRKE